MSNKTSRQIEDGLKQLLWEAGRERFPYPDHFPASDFYPMPVTLLATREPRWLYFLDYMFGHLDEQGAIEINLDRAVAYGGVKERTLQKYLAKIVRDDWLIAWEEWLLQRADEQLVGIGWESLSRNDRKRYVKRIAGSGNRTKIYLVTGKFLQGGLFYKPRDYIRRGWSDYRRDVAARQVVNGLFWGFNQQQKRSEGRLSSLEMSRWELRNWTKKVHGDRTPEGFRSALDEWVGDGLLLRQGENRFRFELAIVSHNAPGEKLADRRHRLRMDIQREQGLNAYSEKEKITLLVDLVEQKIVREREIKTFLNVLERHHPFLLHERQFKKLVDWMIAQHDVRRAVPDWKRLLQDYLSAEASRQPVVLGEWLFRFAQRAADGEVFIWKKMKTPMSAIVLRWRLQPKRQKE